MEYRYSLRKNGKKITCPSCGRKGEFVPYVDENNNVVNAEKYGRCERINSCGYLMYPKSKKGDDWTPTVKVQPPPRPIEYIQKEIVEKTFTDFRNNVFFMYLVGLFGREKAFDLQVEYNIGTAKHGGTIFWQMDKYCRFRTGKVMYYRPNGRRDKSRKSWFAHSRISPDFNYQQCFFGLHLADTGKPIALCESEKTAVLMSVFEPNYTWLATGGSEMINAQRLMELPRLDTVYPDNGQFEKWERKTRTFNRQMNFEVERAVKDGLIEAGSDILDLYLWKSNI